MCGLTGKALNTRETGRNQLQGVEGDHVSVFMAVTFLLITVQKGPDLFCMFAPFIHCHSGWCPRRGWSPDLGSSWYCHSTPSAPVISLVAEYLSQQHSKPALEL